MLTEQKKTAFFNKVRADFFHGQLTVGQVNGIAAILDEWNRRELQDLRWLGYILGTVFHETAGTFQPIEEYGKGKGKPYGQKLKYGGGPGKRVPYTTPDKIYYGRGHTQNTWYENYQMLTGAAKKQGKPWDFLNHPELLLQMEPSIWATFYAMTTGLYTGRQLHEFFNEKVCNWNDARMIINGHDCAEQIGWYSRRFWEALK